jgi:cytochrome c553
MKANSMTRKITLAAVFSATLFLATSAFASDSKAHDEHAEEKVMQVAKVPFGDPIAGAAKVATCAACHGSDGNSANPEWPNIAGQHPEYTYEQLKMIKDGSRSAPLMAGQLNNKNDKDLKDIAAYFAEKESKSGEANADTYTLGQTIYRGGNTETGVPACAACHGPSGKGNPMSLYPDIAGQQAGYVLKSLNDYASGKRNANAQQKIMKEVAALMSDAEKEAVASYIRGL